MARVAQVNLAYNVRTLWFDPNGVEEIEPGDKLVVETARGTEMGVAASKAIEVSDEQIENLKSPLKPVLRKATEEDIEKAAEMDAKAADAMPIFKELAAELADDMHPVSVEYLLSGDKAVFYFESEDRVDFRDLVRQLASRLHVRIDMRQIGVRDEARIVGGLAHCGQVICCERLGGEFNPVSIRMAKNQDLSLNPQKISGLCGRLMCCLRYEDDVYKEFKSRAPKVGSDIETPDGQAQVVELNVPKETVKLRVEEEKPLSIPLADFEKPKSGKRPNAVDPQVWEDAKSEDMFAASVMATFQTSQFTGNDVLGSARAIHHSPSRSKEEDVFSNGRKKNDRRESDSRQRESSRNRRRSGRRKGSTDIAIAADEHFSSKTDSTRKPRRRKSVTISAGDSSKIKATSDSGGDRTKNGNDSRNVKAKSDRSAAGSSGSKNGGRSNRNDRRYSRRNSNRDKTDHSSVEAGSGLRPGHRSSGLSNMEQHGSEAANRQGAEKNDSGHRKPRRRKRRS